MKPLRLWASVLICVAGLALADTPLPPPADYVAETPGATIYGNAARGTTTIAQHAVPGEPRWTIPVWARAFLVAPMGDSILVLNDGLNLLSSNDPATIVATVWYLDGDRVERRPFALGELMDPASLPRTASHWLWLEGYELAETGYRLRLVDGRSVLLTFR